MPRDLYARRIAANRRQTDHCIYLTLVVLMTYDARIAYMGFTESCREGLWVLVEC